MGVEIERKFLVVGDAWKRLGTPTRYQQGYITHGKGRTVRVRIGGERAYLTVKGPRTGTSRSEFEYPIPVPDAREMLDTLCEHPIIEKTRYVVPAGGLQWEVDEFFGENAGLVIAEIELHAEDQPFDRPAWIGAEVTGDKRYYNAYLVKHPFRDWR